MAIELITGKGGEPHVDSADIGAYQAYTVGEGVYILHGMEATLPTSNSIAIAAGDGMGHGRHFRIVGAGETATIDNGQSGYKRNDIVAVKYMRDGNGIETPSLVVFKGTPTQGNPVDPAIPAGNVLDNATVAYWPLYRVTMNGLTPQAPVALAGAAPIQADPIVEVLTGDDAPGNAFTYRRYKSGMVEVIGSLVKSTGGMVQNVLVDPITLYKPGASNVGAVCYVQNGDPNAMSAYVNGVNVQPDGNVAIQLSTPHNGAFRVNFHYIIQ